MYEPADGTSTKVGDVQVNNILVVADKKGADGTLVGLGVNSAAQPVEVSFQIGDGTSGSPVTMSIPAGEAKQISEADGGQRTTLPAIPVEPGSLIELTVSTAGAGSSIVRVPVVPPKGYYSGYVGGSASPSPTMSITQSSDSSTTAPEQTPAPSASGETNPAIPEPAQTTAP
ncbi:hypothetical protein [Gephyromycinifex aptenodytis]|uniref:hypothetical protein n=1 Tax=Gephyromycinifex aptenodytis TaxID=2716227 RepID=UPI00144795BB|nr:hypothetical protein [Gephyromycinifex aptenodytis]